MKFLNAVINSILFLFIFGSAASSVTAQTSGDNSFSNKECMSCHEKHISADSYNKSVHSSLMCQACHVKDETKPVDKLTKGKTSCIVSFKPSNCSNCHSSVSKEHETSVHNSTRLPVSCSKCHSDIHNITSIKNNKKESSKLCAKCHENESAFFRSVHFKAIEEGSNDAPGCTDCHNKHAISKIDNISQGRTFHTQACMKCHSDEEMMKRSNVTTIAPKSYFESYHGKNIRLGYPEKVAGCADCHSSHNILPAKDTNSTVYSANLTNTCKQCHVNAGVGFSKFIAHADPGDSEKYPLLYWVTMFMNLLLAGTFLFFWIHSLLWVFRGFVEKKQKRNEENFSGEEFAPKSSLRIKRKVYRRFRPVHITMHLFVVTSFLALAITGLPLKFNYTSWGKTLMDYLGGISSAGLIHRAAAIITFGYFTATLVMSIRFLFSKKNSKQTFLQRLFGPDSLFINRKDLADINAMFRWFFFRGPKPSFDRWTYWEKFDFLAVFWGVAIIGSSGLVLWFPEFFSSFLPGWIFNMATIIHSDEALLAVGFIFTVHFFNTHLRVEKFPMDFVIFNGQVTEKEMVHERGDQWKRYIEQGVTDKFEVKKPTPIVWDITLRVFGLVAVLTGTVLALLIFYSILGQGWH
ncbi:MAG TPA: cytochrome C [Ignavibacteria bacterium]|nr:cytochrome C [Ignavibacteria bacterium]HMQ99282.1 cytochrome C [Ignavibacteria bacterium]